MNNDRLKILVVDDEPAARKKISSFLKNETGNYQIKEAGNGLEAAEKINEFKPDLVFLDIQMPGMTGFELIKSIGAKNMPAAVFTTAYDQYAIDAFEVNAVDYLLKPFDNTRFQKSFLRALEEIKLKKNPVKMIENLLVGLETEKKSIDKFLVKKGQKYFFVPVEKVYCITAEDKYVQVSAESESYLVRETISNLEAKLPSETFKKIHRSAIININYVKEIQPWSHGDFIVILTNGKKLNASRKYRSNIFGEDN